MRDQNQKLVWSSAEDKNGMQNDNSDRRSPVVIKQEPSYASYATHEVPRNYATQEQRYANRDQLQRNLPSNDSNIVRSGNIFVTKGQLPSYHSARGAPRDDESFRRKYNPG